MSDDIATSKELVKIDYKPGKKAWMDVPAVFRKGTFHYGSNPESVEYLGLPYARKFDARDEDWNLPENWKELILEGLRVRLKKYRSLQIFMDICVDVVLAPTSAITSSDRVTPRTCPFSARNY